MKRFLLALALCGASPLPIALAQGSVSVASGGVAAEVNGDKIYVADLNRMVETVKKTTQGLDGNSPEAQKNLSDVRAQLLDQMITTRLLAQEARRQKITPKNQDVEDAINKLRATFASTDEFQTMLKSEGKSESDLRRIVADDLAIRELSKQLTATITVSDADIAAYYKANTEQFQLPAAIAAHHILLAVNANASDADKAAVKKRAQGLLAQLQAGAKFEELAKVNSDDPGTKDNGGNLGTFARGDMVQEFEDVAFKTPVNQLTLVTTEFGVHILRVDNIIPAHTLTLQEVQANPDLLAQIKTGLLKQKVQDALDKEIGQLRASATIKKNV